jgi:hypothetical protein
MSLTADSVSIADEIARAGGRQVRRYVNESLSRTAREAGASGLEPCDFVCECGHLTCTEVVRMPLSSFDESSPPGSIVGHGEGTDDPRLGARIG